MLGGLAVRRPCTQSETLIKREGARAMNFMAMRRIARSESFWICLPVCLFTWPSPSNLSQILVPLHSSSPSLTWAVALKATTRTDSLWHLVTYNNIILGVSKYSIQVRSKSSRKWRRCLLINKHRMCLLVLSLDSGLLKDWADVSSLSGVTTPWKYRLMVGMNHFY